MNEPIVIDTNAIISLFDGNHFIADMLDDGHMVVVPAIVCGEFETGAQGKTRRESVALSAFNGFLGLSHVSVLPVTRRTGRIYARLFTELKRAGTPIPTNDIWIAACAIECNGILLSNDHHFSAVTNVHVATY